MLNEFKTCKSDEQKQTFFNTNFSVEIKGLCTQKTYFGNTL